MTPRSLRPPILYLLLGLAACSASSSGGGSGGTSSATGGAHQSGGQVGSGGASSTGGVTGSGGHSQNSGGAQSSGGNAAGGSVATGGTKTSTSTGGNAAGGNTGDGGTTSTTGGGGSGGSTGTGTAPTSTGGRSGGTTGTTTATGGAGGQTCPALPTAAVALKDIIEFNDNGGWCWYQDERAVVDAKGGKFVIGSIASGGTRNSDQEVVIYDVASGSKKKFTLESDLNPDDHNAPAFVVNPDGTYAAIWATHRDTCFSYYSTYNGTSWVSYKKYDWAANGCPWDQASNPSPAHMVTYANPWYLSAENKILSSTRSVSTSPAM